MNLKAGVCLVFLLLATAAPRAAQQVSPESVAQEYFSVLQKDGIGAMGRFMHPDAQAQFKRMIMPLFESEAAEGKSELRAMTFGRLATLDEIKALDPEAFMNGFMRLVVAQTGDVKLSFDKLEIVGVVPEGEQRHVLARVTIGANELKMTEFQVLSFLPFKDTWRMQLNGEMQGLAAALKAGFK